jgi:hypothetical protein
VQKIRVSRAKQGQGDEDRRSSSNIKKVEKSQDSLEKRESFANSR